MASVEAEAARDVRARPVAWAAGAARGRRPWPAGLIGMLALVAAAERFVARHDVSCAGIASSAWKWSGEHVRAAARCRVVGFGDSLAKNSLLPSVIEARSGMNAWNLAAPAGVAPLHYFLFRRLIRAGARPGAVLIDAESIDADPLSDFRAWDRTIGLGDAADLAWAARDLTFLTNVALAKLVPSYGLRHGVRSCVVSSLGGKARYEPVFLLSLWVNWNRNQGGYVLPDPHDPPGGDPRPAELERACYRPAALKPHPVNDVYFRRFLDLAAARGIPVYWLLTPLHPEVQARRDRYGRAAAEVAYVRGLQRRYPGLKVIDGRRAGYPPEALSDMTHLGRTGAVALSHAVGGLLRDRDLPRWIDLPRYDAREAVGLAAASGVEDLEASNQAFSRMCGVPVQPAGRRLGAVPKPDDPRRR